MPTCLQRKETPFNITIIQVYAPTSGRVGRKPSETDSSKLKISPKTLHGKKDSTKRHHYRHHKRQPGEQQFPVDKYAIGVPIIKKIRGRENIAVGIWTVRTLRSPGKRRCLMQWAGIAKTY